MATGQTRNIAGIAPRKTAISGRVPTGTTIGEIFSNLPDQKLWGYDGSIVFEYGSKSFLGLTGGTITGNTRVIGNLSADTIYGDGSNLVGIVTGFTYNNSNKFTISRNGLIDLDAIISIVTALTITTSLNVVGGAYINSLTADTLVTTLPILPTKAGIVNGVAFSGDTKKSTIIFSDNFEDNNYTVTVTGEDNRSWRIESKTLSGFTIDASANSVFSGDVFWQAIAVGESSQVITQNVNLDGGNAESESIDLNIDGGNA